MRNHLAKRLLSLMLAVVLVCGLVIPAHAVENGSEQSNKQDLAFEKVDNSGVSASKLDGLHADDPEQISEAEYSANDVVRVSIVLEDPSTLAAGYSTAGIANNAAALSYRVSLKANQEKVTSEINAAIGSTIDVKWNLTLAANIISANVAYSQIDAIKEVPGVKDVVLENRYEPDVVDTDLADDPNMATSGAQIGSAQAWAAGYTGAGSRIAVIDTGIDLDHQSFDASGFNYSLAYRAGLKNMSVDEYIASLDLLDAKKIEAVLDQLNIAANSGVTADKLYQNTKVPFGYNYVDENFNITHDTDTEGEHGSHVEGIAAANAFIPNGDGTFSHALESVFVQGVAPDAQIITMKVFGSSGGAYDSDYMAAIEDAIVLGCDAVNLSLGSGNPGFSRSKDYQAIMDSLTKSDTVVSFSAGNSGSWADSIASGAGYLYGDDVGMHAGGSPGSFTNSFTTASVDNVGSTGNYFTVSGKNYFYSDTSSSGYKNEPFTTLASQNGGEYSYILIDGFGTADDFAALGDVVEGKIVAVSRGTTSFYQKADEAAKAGAVASIIYNNQPGVINMDLSSYSHTAPSVSITQADGAALKAAATPVKDADGNVLYYEGTLTVTDELGINTPDTDIYTMSDFSAWGVPGSLELKPEITAPGGNIYSVNGAVPGGKEYESMSGTSMAAPQIAGMAAVVAQYIRENGLEAKTGRSARQLAISLLMSTAKPLIEADSGNLYSVLKQGAGLANVANAISADSYIMMIDNLSGTAADGKVKAELGDDPNRDGVYSYSFTINNLTDVEKAYTLRSDFFTQDIFADEEGTTYLDTWTTLLNAYAVYTVDGETYVPTSKFDCDLDHDGDTDADDAQVIINYVVGKIAEIDEIADLDADGSVTSYDAYLLLKSLEVNTVKVPANGSVTVTVTVTLNDKEALNAKYPKGAFVEGYTYVEPHTTEEGVVAPAHSIPVLGFYGNWSEPAMFDRLTTAEYIYASENGTPFKIPYTGVAQTNNLLIRYPGDSSNYWSIGNPYVIEKTYPVDRLAISSSTSMYQYRFSLIRNAAALFVYYQDADGKIIDTTVINEQAPSAYYYVNGGSWQNTAYNITMNQKVASLGLKEGDKFTVGVVAIPEYYEDQLMEEKTDADGNTVLEMSDEKAVAFVESGVLGEGAFLSSTFTVDDTAPALLQVSKDLLTGELTVVAQDNEYVSSIQILNGHASKVLMGGLPNQTQKNQVCGIIAPLDDSVGEYVTVLVTDYAGNEAMYKVYYGGTPEDYTGRMFGFTASAIRGNGQRWVEIMPDELYYTSASDMGGMVDHVPVDQEVYAADYIDGYVFFATDSSIYVSEQDYMEAYQKVADFPENVNAIFDMAYNYKDGKLYALDDTNTIYTVDTISGAMEKVATISVTNPKSTSANYKTLAALAIDDDGNFYAVNHGSSSYSFLYTFTLADVVDGAINNLDPVDNTSGGILASSLWFTGAGALAWDHDNDQLYFASGYGSKNSADSDNELWIVDTATGKASKPGTLNGQLRANVAGLYIVPSASQSVPSDSPVTSIQLSKTELTLMQGSSFTVSADVFPWVAQDKSIAWTSSDETIATVSDGVIAAVAPGTATITATSVSTPNVSATCEVTVTPIPTIHLSALVYGNDSQPVWAEFDTDNLAAYTVSGSAGSYSSGTLAGDKLYLHDGSTMYAVDPDSFEATALGGIASSWLFSDAAPMASCIYESMGNMPVVAPCMNGTYLMTLDPEAGSLSYWKFEQYFADDPMAVIALAGETVYKGENAGVYYVMTESGELWMFLLYGEGYCARGDLGATGLSLGNVSANGNDKASMFYDAQSGMLVISSYCDGDSAASVYVLDPEELIPAKAGEFAADVWPVTALYQYERATDLTLKLDPMAVTIYEGDSIAISSKVILGTTDELVWKSSDANVATVDENGVITAVGEGEATVTATTVAKNAAGETVSASVAVTVKGMVEVSGMVSAQITTASGTSWVDIDLANNMSVTEKKTGATAVTGGGYSGDSIYASDVDLNGSALGSFYSIDPSTFAETAGSQCSSSYAPLDTAVVPSCDFTYTENGSVVYSGSAFTDPLYLANAQGLYFLKDFEAGSISGWNLSSYYSDLGAIANIGWVTVEFMNSIMSSPIANSDVTNHAYWILALGADGTLYNMFLVPKYDAAKETIAYSIVRAGAFGNVGIEFSDYQKLSMDYVEFSDDSYGVLIADGTDGSVYYANLAGDDIVTGKVGKVAGASNITALYNAQASDATARVSEKLMHRPINDRCSSVVSMSSTIAEIEAGFAAGSAEASANINAATGADVAVNAVTGSLNAVKVTATKLVRPAASVMSAQPSITDNAVSISISDDVAANNGKYVVTYDPSVLTFESASVNGDVSGYTVDETTGTVIISFASLVAIDANAEIAKVNFTYKDAYIDTSVTVETTERNDNVAVTGESETVELTHEVGEHAYVVTDSKEPTCTEDGYKTYTCSKCGDSYTEIIPALGHKEEVRGAKAATCDEAGYTGDTYCSVCGELLTKGEVIPALGHDFVKGETVSPTETEEGYTIYKCSRCGKTEKRDIVPATGKPSTPSTGDNGILLPALLLLVSAMGITTVCVFRKREQN